MNTAYLRSIYLRLAGVVALVVTLALLAQSFLSQRTFEAALAPQMAAKVASEGASVRALVLKAADNNIPLDGLYGVKQRFHEAQDDAREISYMAIADAGGRLLYESDVTPPGALAHFGSASVQTELAAGRNAAPLSRVGSNYFVSMPITHADKPLGTLHLGMGVKFIDGMMLDMLYDVGVVLIVSLFFTLELLHFVAGINLEKSLRQLGDTFERGAAGNFTEPAKRRHPQAFESLLRAMESTLARVNESYAALARSVDEGRRAPAHERAPGLAAAQAGLLAMAQRFRFGASVPTDRLDEGQLALVRAPLFMFILAEELTRSFIPGYVKELLVPIPWLSPQLVVGLPIALFMLIVAIGQPFFGVYCERVGHRRTMLVGAGVTALGFVATAMAHNVLDLLLWRSLCAIGYAMVFVAGQSFVLDNATPSNRARSFAVFIGAIMAASVCGPSIGGILADNIGQRPTFMLAAALALCSMAVIRMLPRERTVGHARRAVRLPRLAEIGALVTNRRFMTVTGLAAMPAKILLTGVCFYLIPLYVLSVGSTQAMAGRILMTYAVMMVVLTPLTAKLATSPERMQWLVGGGLMISGAGAMLMLAGGGVGWVFLAVTLVGLGQSMSISAQSALVSEHCQPEIEQLGDGVVYGVYRLLERMGNAAGPLIAAGLVLMFDYRTSFVAIGVAVLLCGVAFQLATWRSSPPQLAAA